MTQAHLPSEKGPFAAAVISNRRIGECFWTMTVRFTGPGAKAFARFEAGQFLQIDVSEAALPAAEAIPPALREQAHRNILLRRPFSFARVTPEGDATSAELLYCVLGPATLRMTTLDYGQSVSIIGPLGNGFSVPENKKQAILVVGGMGLPPISCLAKSLTARRPDIDAIAFVGAKTSGALPFENRLDEISKQLGFSVPVFAEAGIPSVIATDDGSAGHKGMVTEELTRWLDENSRSRWDETIVYACGPEPMLAAVAAVVGREGIDCQVSMERRMGCGIGLCQSCAIECRVANSEETVYKLCCKDGPVFDARDVVFER